MTQPDRRAAHPFAGFTLLELLTVMCVIAILAVMLLPALGALRSRAEAAACMANMRNLYVGASAYLQQYGHWPQIAASPTDSTAHDEQWIEALLPLGVDRNTWVCPTTQRLMGNPPVDNPQAPRADYVAFPFDSKPGTPYRWANMPWFVEKGNSHGNGSLLIFMNGSTKSLKDIEQETGGT